jgi:hypothetical protein
MLLLLLVFVVTCEFEYIALQNKEHAFLHGFMCHISYSCGCFPLGALHIACLRALTLLQPSFLSHAASFQQAHDYNEFNYVQSQSRTAIIEMII